VQSLSESQPVSVVQPKNLICNFRAPNLEQYQRWKVYVKWAKDNGQDVCHLTLSLTDAFMKGVEGAAQVRNASQIVNIQQNNVFQYQVFQAEARALRSEFCKKGVSDNNQ